MVEVFDQNGQIIDDQSLFDQKGDSLNISLSNYSGGQTILLPRRKYQSLNISYNGSKLEVGNNNNCCRPLNINIKTTDAFVRTNVATSFLKIYSNTGIISINGKVDKADIVSNTGNIYGNITSNRPRRYDVYSNTGDISLSFPYKARPTINPIFKKIRDVNGRYIIGRRYVNLNLKTNTGLIKVR
jgi:hypothetical protein